MQIGCGCVNLGSSARSGSLRRQIRLVHAALDAGVTVLDTADAYGSGASETVVGQAVQGRRDDVVIATKAGYLFRPRSSHEQRLRRLAAPALEQVRSRRTTASTAAHSSANPSAAYAAQEFSAGYLRRALDESLRRLRTDHVDVFQLHGPPDVLGGIFAELDDLRTSGKVGRFGVGAESPESAMAWASAADGLDVLQVPFGVLDPDTVDRLDAVAGDREIWARGVLGGGVIALAMGDADAVADHPRRPTIEALREVSAESGLALDELAVRWAADVPDLAVILLGMSSEQHLHRNIGLLGAGPLPADVRRAVDEAIGRHAGGTRGS